MDASSPATFAALLRRHRLAAGLTQEDLAERAGLSARGVQDLERGVRLSPRAETIRLLAEALDLDTTARIDLLAAARPELAAQPLADEVSLQLAGLPVPPSSLVGREQEVAAACALLQRSGARLLTLTGPGGVGKTRMALAVASELAPDFGAGAAWAELAALRDPALVAGAVARALGAPEGGERSVTDALTAALGNRRLLLVLDNCEHVLPAMPLVAHLLAACPRLSVLATSRARLRLRGERELAVGPLPAPAARGAAASHLAGLAGTPAVRLFVERAQAIKPTFALTEGNAPAVAAVCRRLDGLPLALELAAARIKVLPPEALLERLEQRLPLLSGGDRDLPERQQTMRDAIAWSHDLLSASEQVLFRRLAVFAGGCTLDAAAAVTATAAPGQDDQAAVLDGLSALVDQSLIRQDESAAPGAAEARFAMLETVREYAWERLAESGEATAARHAHAAFFLALAERAEPELTGPAQAAWLDQIEAEHDNLRAALAWSLGSDSAMALRLAAALGRFWRMHGHPREGLSWLERSLASSADAPSAARGKVLEGAGRLSHDLGQSARAEALSEAALEIWRALGDQPSQAQVLDDLGNVAHDRGDFARAMALHEQALDLAREAGDRRGTGRALNNLAMVALYQSQDELAWRLYNEALAVLRDVGDGYGVNVVLTNLGIVAIRRGDLDHAAAVSHECLAGCRELGDEPGIGIALVNLAEVTFLQGNLAQAEALFEEARTVLQNLGDDRAAAEACSGLATLKLTQGNDAGAASLFGTSLALAHGVGDTLKAVDALEGVASVAVRHDETERAALVLGAAAAIREQINAPVAAHRRAGLDRIIATSRAALDEATFAAAWAVGQGWTLEQAISEAQGLAAMLASVR